MADICIDPSAPSTTASRPHWKIRLRACSIHFVFSLLIAVAVGALVFGLWYPPPYRDISGGRTLFLLLMGIDVVLGPLVTLLIFNPRKSRRELTLDLALVGLLQLGALGYGVWTVYAARPVHLVFEYQRLAVVHAVDIPESTLMQAPPALQSLPRTGPTLLSLRALQPAEMIESTMLALDGIPQAAQPGLWRDYDAGRVEILEVSQPLDRLQIRFPHAEKRIAQAVRSTGLAPEQLRTLPLLSRQTAWTALIDSTTARPIGFLELDSF